MVRALDNGYIPGRELAGWKFVEGLYAPAFYLRSAVIGKSSIERAEAKFKKGCGLKESAIHESTIGESRCSDQRKQDRTFPGCNNEAVSLRK